MFSITQQPMRFPPQLMDQWKGYLRFYKGKNHRLAYQQIRRWQQLLFKILKQSILIIVQGHLPIYGHFLPFNHNYEFILFTIWHTIARSKRHYYYYLHKKYTIIKCIAIKNLQKSRINKQQIYRSNFCSFFFIIRKFFFICIILIH